MSYKARSPNRVFPAPGYTAPVTESADRWEEWETTIRQPAEQAKLHPARIRARPRVHPAAGLEQAHRKHPAVSRELHLEDHGREQRDPEGRSQAAAARAKPETQAEAAQDLHRRVAHTPPADIRAANSEAADTAADTLALALRPQPQAPGRCRLPAQDLPPFPPPRWPAIPCKSWTWRAKPLTVPYPIPPPILRRRLMLFPACWRNSIRKS